MRYWYDTEFIEDGTTIDLVSIGIVSEDGREYYAHSAEYDEAKANEFVRAHVLPQLAEVPRVPRSAIRDGLTEFFAGDRQIDLWGYFSAWDHIALMQLWGSFADQPYWLPMRTNDVCTYAQMFGCGLPRQSSGAHDALEDARHTRVMFEHVQSQARGFA